LAVKKFKEKSWEEFGCQLDSNYSLTNKVFWQTIRWLSGKRSNSCSSIKDPSGNILSDENEILSRKYFEPIRTTNDEAHKPICFGEEKVFTAREVAAAIG